MTMRFSKAMAIGAFFLCAGHAHAASSYLFDNPENRAFLGVRVGLDISSAANGGILQQQSRVLGRGGL